MINILISFPEEEPMRKEKPERDVKMNEEEAATIIQKKYRGYVIRKEYGPVLKSTSGKLDEESAIFMKNWYKKWKAKSIFQVLLIYRAVRLQDLVYFCQQAHLYNINFLSCLQENNISVNLNNVNTKAQPNNYLPKNKPSVYKLKFRLKDLTFFDDNYISDPFQNNRFKSIPNGDEEESWDAAVHVPGKYNKYRLEKGCQTTLDKRSGNGLLQIDFVRDPNKPIAILEKTDKSCQFEQKQKFDEIKKNYDSTTPIKPAQVFFTKDKTRNDSSHRPPIQVRKSQNIVNPIKELEEKYKRTNTDDTDEPPYNFRALLRKTNSSRNSFKQNENIIYNSEFRNNNIRPSSVKRNRNKKIIITELVPGLVVKGEIAEL